MRSLGSRSAVRISSFSTAFTTSLLSMACETSLIALMMAKSRELPTMPLVTSPPTFRKSNDKCLKFASDDPPLPKLSRANRHPKLP